MNLGLKNAAAPKWPFDRTQVDTRLFKRVISFFFLKMKMARWCVLAMRPFGLRSIIFGFFGGGASLLLRAERVSS